MEGKDAAVFNKPYVDSPAASQVISKTMDKVRGGRFGRNAFHLLIALVDLLHAFTTGGLPQALEKSRRRLHDVAEADRAVLWQRRWDVFSCFLFVSVPEISQPTFLLRPVYRAWIDL